MTAYTTKLDIKNAVSTRVTSNNNREVSARDVRDSMEDIVDTLWDRSNPSQLTDLFDVPL